MNHSGSVAARGGRQGGGSDPITRILWRAEDVAERLEISRSHVFELARRGEIPQVRIGRLVRFPANEIQRWIDGMIEMPR